MVKELEAKNENLLQEKEEQIKELDKIEKIRYGNTQQYSDLENGVMVGNFSGAGLMYKTEMAVSGENADMTSTIEINPKAIEISESVVVSWEIK